MTSARARRLSGPALELVAAAVVYVLALGASRHVSAGILLLAAAATLLPALGWAARRVPPPRNLLQRPDAVIVAATGMPVHLLLLATGGLASPWLPLLGAWVAGLGMTVDPGVGAAAGVGVTALTVVVGGVTPSFAGGGLLEAALLVAGGAGAALLRPGRRRFRARRLDRPPEWHAALPESWPGQVAEGRTLEELRQLLDAVRDATRAARAVLWDVDEPGDRARPALVSGGTLPNAVVLTGDPLRWAWEAHVSMRLDRPPAWSSLGGGAVVVPLHQRDTAAALLTLEYARGSPVPEPRPLEQFAALLRSAVNMYRRETATIAERDRLLWVLDTLRSIPAQLTGELFAPQFADEARRLAGGTGALIASWAGESGRILAVVGDDGGPVSGMPYGAAQSELALVARGGTLLVREELRPQEHRLPLCAPGERWFRPPQAYAVIPLADASHGVSGLVAVWSSERERLEPMSVETLHSIAPYVSIQLRHSLEFDSVQESARRDPLTGMHNRRSFEDRLTAETARYHRYRHPLSLLVLDLDHFKQINDRWGHEAGDAVLRAVARVLEATVRETDTAARYGGEEFVVVAPEAMLRDATEMAERIRAAVERLEVVWGGTRIPIHISVGVAACPECVEDPGALMGSADAALYRSKEEGRNRVSAARIR